MLESQTPHEPLPSLPTIGQVSPVHAVPPVSVISGAMEREGNTSFVPLQATSEWELSAQEQHQLIDLTAKIRKNKTGIPLLHWIVAGFLWAGSIWFLIVAIAIAAELFNGGLISWEALFVPLGMGGVGLMVGVPEITRRRRLNRSVEALLTFDDKRMAGVLTELLPLRGYRWSKRANRKLGELLFRLEATDQLLDNYHCQMLTYALKDEKDAYMLLAILHALERVGTIPSLPFISLLASGGKQAQNSVEIRNAAISCQTAIRKQLTDKRCLSLLLDYVVRRTEYVAFWPEARWGLLYLLPQMTPADRYLIKKHHIQPLQAALLSNDVQLVQTILCASQQVGLVEVLPALGRLTVGAFTGNRPEVRAQAQACYAVLRQLEESAKSGQTLLRAAAAPGIRGEELVRPSEGISPTDPSELLRGTHGSNDRGSGQ